MASCVVTFGFRSYVKRADVGERLNESLVVVKEGQVLWTLVNLKESFIGRANFGGDRAMIEEYLGITVNHQGSQVML